MIVIRTVRLRLLALLCGSSAFVALGFWFILWPPLGGPVGPTLLCVLGVASVLFFGLLGGIFLKRLLGHRIALVLDRRGIIDNSSACPAGRILWEELTDAGVVTSSGARFLGLDVKNREALYARVARAGLLRENASLFHYPVQVPEIVLDRTVEALLAEVLRYRDDPRARETLGEPELGI